MWHVARYRGCMECLVALLVLQIELAMAFLHIPRTRGSMRQPNVAPCKVTPNPTEHSKPTTRHGVMQELSAVAGVIAASGAVLANNPPEAKAELSVTPSVLTQEDRRGVEKTTIRWKDTVTSGVPDAPGKTAALYAPDGVLWGTVSEEVRDTPGEIYDYFDYFARLPKLEVSEYTPVSLRVYGDFATQAGTYTFAWQGGEGRTMEKRARFSFTFRRDPSSSTGWTIVEHHSSVMPTSPAQLKHAKNTES